MLRCLAANALRFASVSTRTPIISNTANVQTRLFSIIAKEQFNKQPLLCPANLKNATLDILPTPTLLQQQSVRTVTKFSLKKGKRKSVKAVIKRFKRLHWGAWIRTYTGRHKKMFKKSAARKRRLRQHVFVNSTQSWLLDKMVTQFWKKPKYYIDDPYEPYHQRNEFFATKQKTFKV